MSHGLEVYDSDGELTYSTNDVTWNQVDAFYVAAGDTVSKTYPVINNRQVLLTQVLIDPPDVETAYYAATLARSGTTVTVSGSNHEKVYVMVLYR